MRTQSAAAFRSLESRVSCFIRATSRLERVRTNPTALGYWTTLPSVNGLRPRALADPAPPRSLFASSQLCGKCCHAESTRNTQDRQGDPMRTDKTRRLPAFFTQVIGSLPRPKLVRDLHAR